MNVVSTMELKKSTNKLPTNGTMKNALDECSHVCHSVRGSAHTETAECSCHGSCLVVTSHNVEYNEVRVQEHNNRLNKQDDDHRKSKCC